jgi:hypothetical protein
VSLNVLSFELSFSPTVSQLSLEIPIAPGIEIGIQNDLPSPDYLYLVIENRNWGYGKEKRTYCLDPDDRTLEIIPNVSLNSSLRFFVGKDNFAVGFNSEKPIQYQTSGDYHWLFVDMTSGDIADFEIKPTAPYYARVDKPEPLMKFCSVMMQEENVRLLNVALVCASNLAEEVIGVIPFILSHVPLVGGMLAKFSLLVIYALTSIHLVRTIKQQPDDNWKGIFYRIALIAFLIWLFLLWFNILPYALM